MAQSSHDFLREWLWASFEAVPIAALNAICFRVKLRLAYEAYQRAVKEKRKRPEPPSEFLDAFLECFPEAKVSDWRFLEGSWEKEIEGVKEVGTLFKSVKLKPREFISPQMRTFSPKED